MLLQSGQDHFGATPALVVLGLIDPEDLPIGIDEQGRGNRQGFYIQRARVDGQVAKTECIRDREIIIGDHDSLDLVFSIAVLDVFRRLDADGHDLHIAFVELTSKFFPSP